MTRTGAYTVTNDAGLAQHPHGVKNGRSIPLSPSASGRSRPTCSASDLSTPRHSRVRSDSLSTGLGARVDPENLPGRHSEKAAPTGSIRVAMRP